MAKSCPYCGTILTDDALSCFRCRETLPEARGAGPSRDSAGGKQQIRHGLIYIFLGGIIHYFASGLSGLDLPIEVPAAVTSYLTPLLMLGGVGLIVYGIYARIRG